MLRSRLLSLPLAASLGCGAHLHRPQDAATAEAAESELKAARLVDGFAEELAQSSAMSADELEVARAWAEAGRNRDLLDVLAATGEADPDTEILFAPRCRGRYKGDGWTTLCSKISTRLLALTGFTLPEPAGGPAPAAARPRRGPEPAPPPGPGAALLREVRGLQRHWKGPNSGESQLGRAANEYTLTARVARVSGLAAPPPLCPGLDLPSMSPDLRASHERLRGLCRDRRDNLRALAERAVCRDAGCGPSELAAQVERALAIHDAIALHHDELTRRIFAYETSRRPCDMSVPTGPEGQTIPGPRPAPPATPPAQPPAAGPAPRPAAALPLLLPLGAGLITPVPWAVPDTQVLAGPPAGACDEPALRDRLAALDALPVPPALARLDLKSLGRLGRLYELEEQLGALDLLIDERQLRPTRRPADPAAADALAAAPPFARVVHSTIEGIQRVEAIVDAFEVTILALVRETLRVEHDALALDRDHAGHRVRIEHARLAAQLEEIALLLEAQAQIAALDRAGCTQQALVAAHDAPKCRDDLTRALVAFANAWTLGRAAQKQADALDLAARHDASIARSRAAMAMREVYLAAGVAELVKFNKGGLPPEALAQLIVSTVGFAVVAGAVLAK